MIIKKLQTPTKKKTLLVSLFEQLNIDVELAKKCDEENIDISGLTMLSSDEIEQLGFNPDNQYKLQQWMAEKRRVWLFFIFYQKQNVDVRSVAK